MHADEKRPQAVQFLRDAVAYYAKLGVIIKRLLDRQRCGVPLARLRTRLPGAGHRPLVHPRLPPTDQRQGRAVHPVGAARMGVRLDVPELNASNSSTGQLAASLQLAPAAQRHWRRRAHVQAQLVKKQRLEASQLGAHLMALSTLCSSSQQPPELRLDRSEWLPQDPTVLVRVSEHGISPPRLLLNLADLKAKPSKSSMLSSDGHRC